MSSAAYGLDAPEAVLDGQGTARLLTAPEWPDQAVQILLDVADSMTRAGDEQAALDGLAALALRASGADRCAIFVLDPQDGSRRLRPTAAASRVGDPTEQWRKFRLMTPIDVGADPRLTSLWEAATVVTLDHAPASPLIPEPWKRWGSRSLAMAPLHAGGEAFGVLTVDYVTGHHSFSSGEAKLLGAIASAAGVALRNARLVQRLQRAVEVERRLSECATAVLSGRSLREVLDTIVERFTSLLEGTACGISLLSSDKQRVTPVAVRGAGASQGEILIDSLPHRDVESLRALWRDDPQRPFLIPDTSTLVGWESVVPQGVGPGMVIPLWDGKEILGFVAVGRPSGEFQAEEVSVASAFALQAAVAVTQTRLHDMLRARLRVIEALHRLSDTVTRTSELRHVLTALNRDVVGEFGIECDRVSFISGSLTSLLRLKPAGERDVGLIRAWRAQAKPEPHTESGELAVPVPINGQVAGVLWMRTLADPDVTALEVVRAIAGGLGQVVINARMRREAVKRSQELAVASERDRIARDLHDTVGQTFYGIGLKLQDLLEEIHEPEVASRLGELRALSGRAVADVRSAVYALSFLHVRARGLVPSIRMLARQFGRATGVNPEVVVRGRIPKVSDHARSALYRTAHEALVNVERHARATGVVITLTARDKEVTLGIRDDGVGLDQRQVADWRSAAHFGMRTMAKTIREVGGTFSVEAAHPRGLEITASVPVRGSRDGDRVG